MTIKLVTAPTLTPFTLDEVKDHLRQFTNDDDFYIQTLIDAVIMVAQNITRRSLYTTTWKLYLDAFCAREIKIPRGQLQSITHVKYYDTAGDLQTMSASDYQVDTVSEPGRLHPVQNTSWPTTQYGKLNAVEIQFVAGWVKRFDLPSDLRQAMLYHISHMYDIREPVIVGTIIANVPDSMKALYNPHVIHTFY